MQNELNQENKKQLRPIFVFKSKISSAAKRNALKVLDDGWVGLGKVTEEFEEKFAQYCGNKYCVALNSATAALDIIYSYIGLQDELVLTTPLTFVSTNTMLLKNGANVVFGNYDKQSLAFSMQTISKDFSTIREFVYPYEVDKAVIVHYGGLPTPKRDLIALDKSGVIVVNDFAHCAGAEFEDGTKVGSYGAYNVFSFHAVKNLPSPDGGAIVTCDEGLYEYAKKYRWLGIDKDTVTRTDLKNSYSWQYDVKSIGNKYHMNDLTAAILLGQLETLDVCNEYRRHIIKHYKTGISANIGVVGPSQTQESGDVEVVSSGHMAVLTLNHGLDREKFIWHLKNNWNVHPGVHYQHNNEFSAFNPCFNINDSIFYWRRLVTLPCHLEMTADDVIRVIEAVNSYAQ